MECHENEKFLWKYICIYYSYDLQNINPYIVQNGYMGKLKPIFIKVIVFLKEQQNKPINLK